MTVGTQSRYQLSSSARGKLVLPLRCLEQQEKSQIYTSTYLALELNVVATGRASYTSDADTTMSQSTRYDLNVPLTLCFLAPCHLSRPVVIFPYQVPIFKLVASPTASNWAVHDKTGGAGGRRRSEKTNMP